MKNYFKQEGLNMAGNTAVQLTNEEHLVSIKHAIGEELTAYENQLYLMISNIETELEMQKQWLKKFIGQGFAFTNKNPNAFITKLTFIFERVSILHSDRTILVGAVISNKETNSTDSIAIDLTTGDIQYRERKGKYMYDLEVKDDSKASWEYFVHELRRRLDKINHATNYQLDSLEELMEYMWLRPDTTNLQVDIFVDDGGSYLRHEHELLLFVRNGYDAWIQEFIPISISQTPLILNENIVRHISAKDIADVLHFIMKNQEALQALADREISQIEFVDGIVVSIN